VSTSEAARVRELEQENRELRRANEILRRAAVDSTGQCNAILSAEVCGGEDRSAGDVGCVAGAAVGDVGFGYRFIADELPAGESAQVATGSPGCARSIRSCR
jgi:hypothetical protein